MGKGQRVVVMPRGIWFNFRRAPFDTPFGRRTGIADTGRDPMPLMKEAVEIMSPYKTQELIWASPRELLNIFHADEIGCHVITVTHDILKKLSLVGKGLDEYSLV